MKILLTGASGFIGKYLYNYLKDKYQVFTHSRKGKTDYKSDLIFSGIKEILHSLEPDAIVHFGGNPTTKLDQEHPQEITLTNILGTQNLLHYAPKGCRFINASTILVYDETHNCPHTEMNLCKPKSVYGATKLASEGMVHAYHQMGLINGVNLRLTATVGPNMTHGIIPDIWKKLNNDSSVLELLGKSPGSSKPFTHVSDVAKAVELVLNNNYINGNLNIGPDDNISCWEIATTMMKTANKPVKSIQFLGENSTWLGDNKLLQISSAKAHSMGWQPEFPTSKAAIIQVTKDINV